MTVSLDNPTTKQRNFPSSPGCLSKHGLDSNSSKSPRSLVEAFSWEVSSSSPAINTETMRSNRRSSCPANAEGKPQKVFSARVSMARKQARQYSNDNDNMFSIVEEEKPRIAKLDRMRRGSQFHSKSPPISDQKSLPWSRNSLSGPPLAVSDTSSLRRSQFDAAAPVLRSKEQSQPQARKGHFGSHRTHLLSQNLVSERRKIFEQPAAKPPKRQDSIPPPAPIEKKTEPGTPATECSVDEWSLASWIETPTVDSKKMLFH